MTTLKFFYNGIKGSDKKLQKCHYSIGSIINEPASTITIYASNCNGFSEEVRKLFSIKNNTDTTTDYFEKDCIRIRPEHPLYNNVLQALQKAEHRRTSKI